MIKKIFKFNKNAYLVNLVLLISLLSINRLIHSLESNNNKFDDWIISRTCNDKTARLYHVYYLEPIQLTKKKIIQP